MANQASTTCRLRLESTVETSTPPFLGGGKDAPIRTDLQWQFGAVVPAIRSRRG